MPDFKAGRSQTRCWMERAAQVVFGGKSLLCQLNVLHSFWLEHGPGAKLISMNKLFCTRAEYYDAFTKRQKKLHGAWSLVPECLERKTSARPHEQSTRSLLKALEVLVFPLALHFGF